MGKILEVHLIYDKGWLTGLVVVVAVAASIVAAAVTVKGGSGDGSVGCGLIGGSYHLHQQDLMTFPKA